MDGIDAEICGINPMRMMIEDAFALERTSGAILRRSDTAEDYRVHIALPEGEPPAAGWPVLYLLDATGAFGTCVEALRRMGRRPAATGVSPMAVVGLSAPGGYDVARRQRDYTTPRAVAGEGESGHGGAQAFFAFLTGQVQPWAGSRIAIDPSRQTLCGHSLAGFFTLWVLATNPGSFRNYAAISPSVWWDRPALLDVPADTRMRDRRVLIAMGEWEDELPPWQKSAPDAPSVLARRKARDMVAGGRQVARHLDGMMGEGGDVRFTLLAEEDHASILSTAMPRVLRLASAG